jgi:carbon-monoxide dehydrogenase large subunit
VWAAIQSARNGDADPWREPPPIFATLPKGVQADAEEAAAADGI